MTLKGVANYPPTAPWNTERGKLDAPLSGAPALPVVPWGSAETSQEGTPPAGN